MAENVEIPRAAPPILSAELKREIVRYAEQLDIGDYDRLHFDNSPHTTSMPKRQPFYRFDEPDPPNRIKYSFICRLSKVDKVFYRLCSPILWRRVSFHKKNEEKIEYFLREILPRHRLFVQAIAGFPYHATASVQQTPSFVTEALSGNPPARTPQQLFRAVVSPEALRQSTEFGVSFQNRQETAESLSIVMEALSSFHRGLKVLALDVKPYRRGDDSENYQPLPETTVERLLANFRHLTTIDLRNVRIGNNGGAELAVTFSTMETLRTLTLLDCASWFDHRFLVDRQWTARLQYFKFVHWNPPQTLRLHHFITFLSQFSNSLSELTLGIDDFSHQERFDFEAAREAFRLPALKKLAFGVHGFGRVFLQFFLTSPIEVLRIDSGCQTLNQMAWGDFIVEKKDTLKVTVGGKWSEWTLNRLRGLRESVRGRGPNPSTWLIYYESAHDGEIRRVY